MNPSVVLAATLLIREAEKYYEFLTAVLTFHIARQVHLECQPGLLMRTLLLRAVDRAAPDKVSAQFRSVGQNGAQIGGFAESQCGIKSCERITAGMFGWMTAAKQYGPSREQAGKLTNSQNSLTC